jgi:hypothetical protein
MSLVGSKGTGDMYTYYPAGDYVYIKKVHYA